MKLFIEGEGRTRIAATVNRPSDNSAKPVSYIPIAMWTV